MASVDQQQEWMNGHSTDVTSSDGISVGVGVVASGGIVDIVGCSWHGSWGIVGALLGHCWHHSSGENMGSRRTARRNKKKFESQRKANHLLTHGTGGVTKAKIKTRPPGVHRKIHYSGGKSRRAWRRSHVRSSQQY